MGSDCATKQKNSPVESRAGKDLNVNTLSREPDTSKLLAMVDNVTVHNQAYKRTRYMGAKVSDRAYGRLNKSINDLAETAEHLRKDDLAGSNPP
jgi:hypothetical protein